MAKFTPLEVSTWIKKLNPSRSMILEDSPTRGMMMMTMMMMATTLRQLPTTSQGRSVTGDPTSRITDTDTDIQHFFFLFLLLECIFALYFLFETLGCI